MRSRAVPVSLAVLAMAVGACRSEVEANEAGSGPLVGGVLAAPGQFPSTLSLGFGCTGAKVGPRHILTAAHCVTAEDHGGYLKPGFAKGGVFEVTNAPSANAPGTTARVTITRVFVHPGWAEQSGTVFDDGAAAGDVAVLMLEASADTLLAAIPEATIDLRPLGPNDPVTIGGYGCESFPADEGPRRLKVEKTEVLVPPADESHRRFLADYFATKSATARICPGDSGGPVYRDDGASRKIVGVNALSSAEDWYSRLDTASRYDVGSWLASIPGLKFEGTPTDHYAGCTGTKPICGAIARAVAAGGGEASFGAARFHASYAGGVWSQRFARKRIGLHPATNAPALEETTTDPFCDRMKDTGAACATALGETEPQVLYTCRNGIAEPTKCATICERPAFTSDSVPDRCATAGWVDVCSKAGAARGTFFCGSAFGDPDKRAVYRCGADDRAFQKLDCDSCNDGVECDVCGATPAKPTSLSCASPAF